MDDEPFAIKVEHVTKTFRLPHEKANSIKSVVLSLGKKHGYEKQTALEDIDFEIKPGEFYGIVGRNGGGKSTLLKLLAGIYAPDSGQVHVRGKLTPFIELGVGFNPELSGRENVFLNGALLGFNRKEMDDMYDDIVAFAEIERFMDQKLKNYSSGMQVRLAFSIAIRAQSDILLLDEVLAVGDAAFQQKCFNYFEELKQRRQTVVFVSHDMSSVKRFCTKALYIRQGKMIYEGSPAEVADMYALDNLESIKEQNRSHDTPTDGFSLETKIIEQTDDSLTFESTYSSKTNDPLYVAFSVMRDGAPFAELSTPLNKPLIGRGSVRYTLDLKQLNGGMYEIPSILCKTHNREIVFIAKDKNPFAIKGNDPERGAALRLSGEWTYVQGAKDRS